MPDITAQENWQRYQYVILRGHRDYTYRAAKLEGFYLGGEMQADGAMKGGHWSDGDLDALKEQNRPAYEFNGIMPAVNAAVGYQIHNRMDIAFRPRGGDATKELADMRSKVAMQIADNNRLHWIETDVFTDGMVQQRGYFDCRMDFSDSINGELRIVALDPMDVIPDPDAKTYDPESWGDVTVTRWLTLDEIEGLYGKKQRNLVADAAGTYHENQDFGTGDMGGAPRNKFGESGNTNFDAMFETAGMKRYRIIDRQKRVLSLQRVAIHPGGDVRPVGDDQQSPEALAQLRQCSAQITKRMVKRIRWTVSTCDTTLHDEWSPYDRFTVIPYYPFFRRGRTRGMVDNAVGPQLALDKAISQAIHIVNSTANSGWQLEKDQLTNMTTSQLEDMGASTGLVLERKTGSQPLQKIQANTMPHGIEKMIELANTMLKEVTVPDAMRGMQGAEESGIAIQSKQHAAQQGLAVPLDNLARTRNMMASWIDYAIGKYYDSERTFRITKVDPATGKEVEDPLTINQFDPMTGAYLNDMTAGEYDVVVTEQPMQVTFENGQFEQCMEMRTAGIAIPDAEVLRHSNLTNKHDIIEQMTSAPAQANPEGEAKAKLLDAQARKAEAEIEKVKADTVERNLSSLFAGVQTAQTVAAIPQTAAMADAMLLSAGFVDHNAAPIIPEEQPAMGAMPAIRGRPAELTPEQVAALQGQVPNNTHPQFPANPDVGMLHGMGTARQDSIQQPPASQPRRLTPGQAQRLGQRGTNQGATN